MSLPTCVNALGSLSSKTPKQKTRCNWKLRSKKRGTQKLKLSFLLRDCCRKFWSGDMLHELVVCVSKMTAVKFANYIPGCMLTYEGTWLRFSQHDMCENCTDNAILGLLSACKTSATLHLDPKRKLSSRSQGQHILSSQGGGLKSPLTILKCTQFPYAFFSSDGLPYTLNASCSQRHKNLKLSRQQLFTRKNFPDEGRK